MAPLRSGVGTGVEGAQAPRITVNRIRLEKKRVDFCMDRIVSEK
jgi:hypothetical protein